MSWITNTLDKLCTFLNIPTSQECPAHYKEDLSKLKVTELRAMAKKSAFQKARAAAKEAINAMPSGSYA